jgi:DNA-3-methyladenine glycosylase
MDERRDERDTKSPFGLGEPVIDDAVLHRPVDEVAKALIGAVLTLDGVGGVVVETEAYRRDDPASHSFNGPTPRNAAMFGPPGKAYVYRSYGLHWCLNLVCGPEPGSAVLIRALEPTLGVERMQARRGCDDLRKLCAGPGRLCQALDVRRDHDGLDLTAEPFSLTPPSPLATPADLVVGVRIGLSKAIERPWRFGLRGSPFLSRPFAAPHPSKARVSRA